MENVLFIFTDQWRADCLGYHNHPMVKTPNLDKLAQNSVDFTNSYSICPLCTPARGSMFTGLYPHQSGVIDNVDVGATSQEYLPACAYTWLDAMAESGRTTGYFGKWHLGHDWEDANTTVDFDICRSEGNRKEHKTRTPNPAVTERGQLKPDREPQFKNKESFDKLPFYGKINSIEDRFEYKVMTKTVDFLEKNKDEAWCVTASLVGPHFPSILPDEYFNMYNLDEVELPDNFADRFINKPWFHSRKWWPSVIADTHTELEWKKTIAAYYGCVTMMDELIGKILDKAKECSGGRKTRVIFTSDHGEMLGAHSRFDKSAYLYDEVIHTPLLVCEDLLGAQNSVSNPDFCNTLDIAQTFFSLADKKAENGRDLMTEGKEEKEIFSNYYKYNGHSFEVRGIRTDKYKYSYIPQDINELYDLENDPGEMFNLSDDENYKAIKNELHAKVVANMEKNGDYLPSIVDTLPNAGVIGAPEYPALRTNY
ncbi:MAG: sulfatase-like hydrolase/transferase [Clostridia bacterium]